MSDDVKDVKKDTGDQEDLTPDQEFDQEFKSEMNRVEEPAKGKADEKGAVGDKAGTGTGDKDKPLVPVVDAAKAGQDALAAKAKEDTEFLKSIGLDEGEAKEITPGEVERLKKLHGAYSGKIKTAEDRANWFGETNKQLSSRLKTLKGEKNKLSMSQPITATEITAFREQHKALIASLPAGAKRLWADDDYVADKIATARISGASAPIADEDVEAAAGNDLPEDIRADVATAHPDYKRMYQSQEFAAWANAQPQATLLEKLKTAAGHIELLAAFKEDYKKAAKMADELLTGEIVKVHADYEQVFKSPGFRAWIIKQSPHEQAKLRDVNAQGYIEVLTNYKMHNAASEEERLAKGKAQGDSDALRAHGGGTGNKPADDDGWKDPLDMGKEEFQEYERKMLSSRILTG